MGVRGGLGKVNGDPGGVGMGACIASGDEGGACMLGAGGVGACTTGRATCTTSGSKGGSNISVQRGGEGDGVGS